MGMYAVDTADAADLAEIGTAARDGRAVSMQRRRQLSQGKQALNGASDSPAASNGAGAPATAEDLPVDRAAAPPVASDGQGATNGAQEAPRPTAAANGVVAEAHRGRAVSMQRRRQLSQGKQALNGADDRTAAPTGAGAPPAVSNGQHEAPRPTAAANGVVAEAHRGRAVSMQRRRQLSQGKQALIGADDRTAAPTGATGAGAPPAVSNGQHEAPRPTAAASGAVTDAHMGRAISMQRRRQLSQGKQALRAGGVQTTVGASAPPPAETLPVEGGDSGREQARSRRAEASRYGSAAIRRPQREGSAAYAPKVIGSPSQGDQRVTGLRIGPGVRVTGDEPGAALPVTGTQYVAGDGSTPAPAAGPKVGLVRTPQGLVVSGTTVRNRVPITGDEFGEHLPITGEADQKFDDDLTPRSDGTYRSTQFPRRTDPHGASAVGTRLGAQRAVAPSSGDGTWYPLEASDGGRPVTGTAVGRSGRVTGNEAGACRPITGDQYQNISSSSECGGMGGGTAPPGHLNRPRLDPATLGKVTTAQTWGGQRVTGPSVEHRPNVTGDEPGSCRPLTGTPYQGPSTAFGWCEPDEGEFAAQRLDPRPQGVAVTGNVPMHAEAVTGTERGRQKHVTGTPYYTEQRVAEPAADDRTCWERFSVPVALARRLAGAENGTARQESNSQESNSAPPPHSHVPGGVTGSFAVGDGMVTGNNEFLFRPRSNRNGVQPNVTGEGRTDGRPITGSPAAWTSHDRVTGTEGYIAAGRNPTERGGGSSAWAGARRFKALATPGGPDEAAKVTGRVGGSPRDGARVTVSGGAVG